MATTTAETDRAYATRRVRELLDKGWQRRNIVIRVSSEIRRRRAGERGE
jgi:hypothetical protein